MNVRVAACLLSLLAVPAGAVHAQAWPQRGPVTIVSANAAGGAPDIVARMAAASLSESLKQQFIVINRTGGQAIPASVAAARAKPDGYTLYLAGNSALAANVFLVKSLPYDPDRDFTPIAMVVDSIPVLLVVNAKVPASSLAELIDLAKKNPGKLTYAASGSLAPILGDLLNRSAGIKLRQVRYKETSLAVNDTVAGTTDMTFLGLTSIGAFLKQGSLRALAAMSRERFPLLPDVPAMEAVYPGVAIEGWAALVGPAGLPPDIVRRLGQALDPFLKLPDTQARFHSLGMTSRGSQGPEVVREFIQAERTRWSKIVADLGIQPQ